MDRVDNPGGVILTKPGYYMCPSLEDLHEFITDDGKCIVPFLHVGRLNYGYVSFGGPMDISNINLDEIVHFRHANVMLYPDQTIKPAVGEGLNRAAVIVLYNVKPRNTGKYIDIKQLLEEKCLNMVQQRSKFMSHEASSGTWMFTVEHFSMHNFNESDEDGCGFEETTKKNFVEGRAGTSQQSSDTSIPTGLRPIRGCHFYKKCSTSLAQSEQFNRMMPKMDHFLGRIIVDSELILDNEVPTLRVKRDLAYLQKQTDIFNEHAKSQALAGQDKYLSSAWNLCSVLWDPDDNSSASRRKCLSDWFAKNTSENSLEWQVLKRLRSQQSDPEVFNTIFKLLTVYKVEDAFKFAREHKLIDLAYLLTLIDSHEKFEKYVREYINSWEGLQDISDECKKVYFLLAGVPTHNTMNICDGLNWMQNFGLHLWYIAPPAAPIDAVFNLYKKAFKEDKYAAKPTVPYCDSDFETTEYDLLYHIIGVYADRTYQLYDVLHPETHTGNVRDFRFSWLMLQLFSSLETGQIRESEKVYLHTSLATQLTSMGEWNWAVVVLLYLDNNVLKKELIMNLLERHLSPKTILIERYFVDVLKIPSSWIAEVRIKRIVSLM